MMSGRHNTGTTQRPYFLLKPEIKICPHLQFLTLTSVSDPHKFLMRIRLQDPKSVYMDPDP